MGLRDDRGSRIPKDCSRKLGMTGGARGWVPDTLPAGFLNGQNSEECAGRWRESLAIVLRVWIYYMREDGYKVPSSRFRRSLFCQERAIYDTLEEG